MDRFKQSLVIAAVFTVLGITGLLVSSRQAVAENPFPGSAPVNIVGPLPLPVTGSLGVSGTVNVRNVENIVQTPFQITLHSISTSSFTVDPHKQLTVEFVTSECDADNTAVVPSGTQFLLRTVTGEQSVGHQFFPRFVRNFNSGGQVNRNFYGATDLTRMYADPGTTVQIGGVVSGFSCDVTLSGYTVPK